MYGVPADLPLEPFVNAELGQIGITAHQLHFHFWAHETGLTRNIDVEGSWGITDEMGNTIDADNNLSYPTRDTLNIHRIIGQIVTHYVIDPPISFTLYFKNGWGLTIYDDSERWESFHIWPDGTTV